MLGRDDRGASGDWGACDGRKLATVNRSEKENRSKRKTSDPPRPANRSKQSDRARGGGSQVQACNAGATWSHPHVSGLTRVPVALLFLHFTHLALRHCFHCSAHRAPIKPLRWASKLHYSIPFIGTNLLQRWLASYGGTASRHSGGGTL